MSDSSGHNSTKQSPQARKDRVPALDKALSQQVKTLCFEGYQQYDRGEYRTGLRTFYQAWLLIPKPQHHWLEAGWVLTAIGDAYFRTQQFEQGQEALRSALACPQTGKSPFVQLRLGQCLWELGQCTLARELLAKAHKMGGDKLFAKEDAKFLAAFKQPLSRTENAGMDA